MITTINGPDRVFFGARKDDKARIYLSKPSFACSWYWSFGWLGNNSCHYHLSSYAEKTRVFHDNNNQLITVTEKRNMHIHDALLADYNLNPVIKDNLWLFCELALSIYTLKKAAELFHVGGSHTTRNPDMALLKETAIYDKLSFDLIPSQCQKLWDLMGESK